MSLLVDRIPEWILICQDDIEVSRNLRQYLDDGFEDFTARQQDGIWSLFTAAGNHDEHEDWTDGWFAVRTPQRAWGAQAYLLSHEAARRFVERPPNPDWDRKIDHCVGLFCRREELSYWCHRPSFVRHVGRDQSTFGVMVEGEAGGTEDNRDCRKWCRDAANSVYMKAVG